MMINHITYHVSINALQDIHEPMKLLGFQEVPPDDDYDLQPGYVVRWFRRAGSPLVHYVAYEGYGDQQQGDQLDLGHFCVVVPPDVFERARKSKWCTRDSGSGRIWLCPDNVRIEVRS